MDVDIRRAGDPRVCVLELEGEIDATSVPEVRAALDAQLDGGCVNVVIDLERVVYADSSALGLLVWLDRRLQPLRGRLVLVGANSNVSRVLELSGLMTVAPTIAASDSVASAVEGLELEERPVAELWSETLRVSAGSASLSSTRSRVVEMLTGLGFGEAALFDVRVAVGEALANAVRHGSPGGAEDPVQIDVTAYEDRVAVTVVDTGAGFDGYSQSSDDVYAVSGRGVMFMRALMDSVSFEARAGGGTAVTLVKHRPVEADSDGDGRR